MVILERKNLLHLGSGSHFLVAFALSFAIAKLISIAFNKIFTNILNTAEMGQYTLLVTAVATLATYSALGFPAALSRFTISYKSKDQIKKLKDFVTTGFLLYISVEFLIVIILVILYFSTGFTPDFLNIEPYIYTLLAVAIIAVSQIFSTICYVVASALQNSRYYAIIIIMRVLLQIPLGILFVLFLDMGVFGLILGYCLSEIIVALYATYNIVKDLGIGKFSLKEAKSMLLFSVPSYLSGILIGSLDLGIKVFVDYSFPIDGKEIIALYQYGALTVVNILLIADSIFRMVYRPIIFKYFDQGKHEEMENLTVTITKIFIITIVFGALILFSFSPLLIPFFTKSEYLPSIVVLPILLLSSIIGYLRTLMAYGHTVYFKNYWTIVASSISVVITIPISYFSIINLGLIGMGITYLSLTSIQFFILIFVSQHYFKVKYDKIIFLKLLLTIIFSICIGCIFHFLIFLNFEYSILVSFLIGTIFYTILVIVLKLLTRKDFDFLKSLVKNYLSIIKKR